MIVDCHTHIWQSADQLGPVDLGDLPRTGNSQHIRVSPQGRTLWRSIPPADPEHHWQQSRGVDKVFVLGFRSRHLSAGIPDDFVAEYVRRDPDKLIGFAGIDPADPDAVQRLRHANENLQLRGLTLSPANSNFHPSDSRAMAIYAEAERRGMPIVFHPGGRFTDQSVLEFGRPHLLDEVARLHPRLKIIVASLGHPWVDETICLAGKHPNVFADVSGLLTRSWQAYNALINAWQYGVIEKLLFGSDFPYVNAEQCIASLYSLNGMTHGTMLPTIPREALRGVVERDTLALLGLHT